MKKYLIKFISSLVLGVAVLSTLAISSEVHACSCCGYGYSEIHVADASSFRWAVEQACCDTTIVLDADIYIDEPVDIGPSVIILKNGHKVMQYYKIDHHGYYSVEPVVSYIPNPDMAVYDAYGFFLYYESVPDTKIVTYEDVWHPGWTESGYYEIY